jgi:exonuclease VII small subunit
MSSRKVRVERLIRLRDERLKEEVRKLELTRARLDEAAREHELARQLLAKAEERRRNLSKAPGNVISFIEAEEWLWTRLSVEAEASRKLRLAQAERQKAQGRVKIAQSKLRQLERLAERIAEREREAEARAGRVLDDEIAGRIAKSARDRS